MNKSINRREFCRCILLAAGTCCESLIWAAPVYRGKDDPTRAIRNLPFKSDVDTIEAQYYRAIGNRVQCILCPEYCMLGEGETGRCRVRVNKGRKLYSTVYGQPCSLALHPMEQGPVFHAYPGIRCLAIATAGCNLHCKYCQNWQMSQFGAHETRNYDLSPQAVAQMAVENSCDAVVCTYTEPVVYAEYAMDVATEARRLGLKSVMVTAGYIDPEPMKDMGECFDVVRFDLKGFREDFYENIVGGRLEPILMALEAASHTRAWVEIVTLLVPNFNDSVDEIGMMSKWIVEHLSPDVPLHLLRFFPAYKMRNFPPTPEQTLKLAHKTARDTGLKFVYIGNWPGNHAEHTYCHNCKRRIIQRVSYLAVVENNIIAGKCKFCGTAIPGRWM